MLERLFKYRTYLFSLQGGAQSEAGLTAFVLISLLENNDHESVSKNLLSSAVRTETRY